MAAEHTHRRGPASAASGWVGVVSCHPLVNRFLCDLLRRSQKLRRLTTRAQPATLDGHGAAEHPCAVILDTVLADRGSSSAMAQKVRAKFPGSKLIALASSREEQVIELLQLGFSAVVQITDSFDRDIASAITAVLSGSVWAPEPAIRDYSKLVQSVLEMRHSADRLLTARESQILEWVLWGRPNKEIASDLAVAERTVKFHVSNILQKTGAQRRRDLLRVFSSSSLAGHKGLVPPSAKASM